MARLAVAILVLALAAFALADSQYQYNWNANEETSPISESHLCHLVGTASGCSGCEHGTKGLCAWVTRTGASNGKRVFEENQYFDCVPRSVALAESLPMAGHVCPVDPTKEPSLRLGFRGYPPMNTFPEASVAFSSNFDARLGAFPREPWVVDRTSAYGPVGAVVLWEGESLEDRLDCARIVGSQIVDLHKEHAEDEESTLLNGKLVDDRDKFCVRQALAAFISSRCPEYGVAVSGLCASFYHRLRDNCGPSHLGPNSGLNGYSKALEMWTVVPDDTAYCLNAFPIYPSGEMEEMAGLHIPTATLVKMDAEGKPFWYDPPSTK